MHVEIFQKMESSRLVQKHMHNMKNMEHERLRPMWRCMQMNEIVAVQIHLGSSLAPEMCRNNNYVLIPQSAGTAPRVNVFSTHSFSKTSHLRPSSWATSSLFVHDCKPFSNSSLLLLQTRLGCLWKNSHSASFMRRRRLFPFCMLLREDDQTPSNVWPCG